jgi:hypothetical protein
VGQFSIGVNNNFQQSTLEPSGHVRPVPGSFGSDFVDGHPDQSASRLPLRRQITPSILLTIYIYSYLNRIKAGAAYFAYGASKDSIDLRNHLHRCVFDRSFITA